MRPVDFASADVLPNLPDYFRPHEATRFPRELIGARILRIGTLAEPRAASGGGLVIDYDKNGKAKRLVLEFNDAAMWVAYQGHFGDDANPA